MKNELLEVKRRIGKSSNGHIRSSSLSNGRDRLSLYTPGDETDKSREEVSDNMTHSLMNNNEKLIKNRKPLVVKSAEKKARKVKFYRNGDRFFKGVTLAISSERYRTFDALLSELNRLVGDRASLHHGVRIIFNVDGIKINSVDELLVIMEHFFMSSWYVANFLNTLFSVWMILNLIKCRKSV